MLGWLARLDVEHLIPPLRPPSASSSSPFHFRFSTSRSHHHNQQKQKVSGRLFWDLPRFKHWTFREGFNGYDGRPKAEVLAACAISLSQMLHGDFCEFEGVFATTTTLQCTASSTRAPRLYHHTFYQPCPNPSPHHPTRHFLES